MLDQLHVLVLVKVEVDSTENQIQENQIQENQNSMDPQSKLIVEQILSCS